MSRIKNKKGKSSQIPLFISKLLEMLENTQIVSIIGWTHTQDSFNIKSITRFTENVLPIYFKHRNFSSFIRQLNMYGFRKIRHSDGQNVYQNQNFKKGSKQLLKNINRKMRQQGEQSLVLYRGGSLKSNNNNNEIQQLKLKQKSLEQMCKQFIIQNQRITEENQKIIKRLEQQSKQKDKKLQSLLMIMLAQRGNKQLPYLKQQVLCLPNSQNSPNFKIDPSSMPSKLYQQQNLDKLKDVIHSLYGTKNLLNRQGVMKVEPQPQLQKMQYNASPSVNGFDLERQQSSFLSINDFINADNYQNGLHLEQSV